MYAANNFNRITVLFNHSYSKCRVNLIKEPSLSSLTIIIHRVVEIIIVGIFHIRVAHSANSLSRPDFPNEVKDLSHGKEKIQKDLRTIKMSTLNFLEFNYPCWWLSWDSQTIGKYTGEHNWYILITKRNLKQLRELNWQGSSYYFQEMFPR